MSYKDLNKQNTSSVFENGFPKITPEYEVVLSSEEWNNCFTNHQSRKLYFGIGLGIFTCACIGALVFFSPHLINTKHHADISHSEEAEPHHTEAEASRETKATYH